MNGRHWGSLYIATPTFNCARMKVHAKCRKVLSDAYGEILRERFTATILDTYIFPLHLDKSFQLSPIKITRFKGLNASGKFGSDFSVPVLH